MNALLESEGRVLPFGHEFTELQAREQELGMCCLGFLGMPRPWTSRWIPWPQNLTLRLNGTGVDLL